MTQLLPITFNNFNINQMYLSNKIPYQNDTDKLIASFIKTFELPTEKRNYSLFDEKLAKTIAKQKDLAIKPVLNMLNNTNDEKNITAGLLLLNRIYDEGATKSWDIYPEISKYNYSKSANIQVMLAGIYRKIQVPDAFGPLLGMFLDNHKHSQAVSFDPNEEIGGAILEYLRNNAAKENYKIIKHNH